MALGRAWTLLGILLLLVDASSGFGETDAFTDVDANACPVEDESEACGGGFTIARELLQLGSGGNPCGCSIHGSCQTNGTCICDDGWIGQNCTVLLDCSGVGGCKHGICVLGGFCECDLGWTGADCSVGTCVPPCGEHGSCDAATSTCICDPGWKGRTCRTKTCAGNCTQGNGECIGGECVCYEGFSGPDCAEFVCKGECSGHGSCNEAMRRCECFPWYTGEDCSVGLCPFGCSGRGSCVNAECICDSGWTGAGCQYQLCDRDCSGRGSCVAGECMCQTGYAGVACEFKASCEPADCSGHGTCTIPTSVEGYQDGNATCSCDAGWKAPACHSFMPGDGVAPLSCLRNCSGHGTCLGNSTCECDRGFSGDDCSFAGPGAVSNRTCANGCSGHGACMDGTCVCDYGWLGMDCGVREALGLDCSKNCSTGFGVLLNGTCDCSVPSDGGSCPTNCTGHGACQGGTCMCDFGYGGSACADALIVNYVDNSQALLGVCAGNCSGHGFCNNGTCVCDPMWVGADCSLAVGMNCPENCTGHGTCTMNNTCFCDPGWVGILCEEMVQAGSCAFNCSSRGACVNNTVCVCDAGYTGTYCELLGGAADPGSTPMPGGGEHNTTCENHCSGHGACRDGVCLCEAMYTGAACDVPLLSTMMTCPMNCSGHGSCFDGTCQCDRGWTGHACSQSLMCPNNCTQHGACVNGTCSCDPGWGDADCSVNMLRCPNDCSMHGTCGNGTCVCNIGWKGNDCSLLACPRDCSNHGVCQPDLTCVCDPGWGGLGCDVPECPNSCSGHGACAQNGTCICYFGWEGEACARIADCNKRGYRQCGFCVCDEGYSGELCQVDYCQSSRKYAPHDPMGPPIEVCSGHGRCTNYGCECELGYGGDKCERPANCSAPGGVVCSGNGVCAGGPGRCAGAPNCHDQCVCNQTNVNVYSGPQCAERLCPGPILPGTGLIECSGQGICDAATGLCTCLQANGGTYADEDCASPPIPFLSIFEPQVGPLEGGTNITMLGPGIDRLVTRNNLARIPQGFTGGFSPASDGDDLTSLTCTFLHCPSKTSDLATCTRLEDTPVSWITTAVRKYPQTSDDILGADDLRLEIGDTVRVFGCNPCGAYGRFVGEVNSNGVVGYLPGNLYMYDPTSRNRLFCTSPPAPAAGQTHFELGGVTRAFSSSVPRIFGVNVTMPSPTIWFEYYDYESLIRVLPAKAPLRPFSPEDEQPAGPRGPPDINQPATITISGSYFPSMGDFVCMFFDPSTQDSACRSEGTLVNAGTITCQVPRMRRGKKLVLRTSANAQQFEEIGILFAVFQVVRIDPVCVPMLGVARVTVFGDNLWEEGEDFSSAYCRFGIVASSDGSTSNLALTQWYAYHTPAQPSLLNPGALECDAPPAGVDLEVSNFALSLDACECGTEQCDQCLRVWTPPVGGQNYYLGMWDSTLGSWHYATGLPEVEFHTVIVPTIERIEPSSGIVAGGTAVTFHGTNFTSNRCGWGRNAFPSCRFADTLTTNLQFINSETIVCIAPALPAGIFLLVEASVAIDGQSFISPGQDFQYHLPFATKLVFPRAGPIEGGTEIIITGPTMEELDALSLEYGQPIGQFLNFEGLSCVFFMASGTAVKTPATFSAPTQIKCTTPPAAFAQIVNVRISPNGQTAPAQLSLGEINFAFYNTPRINSLENPYGPVQGGWTVLLRGNFFMDLPDIRCRFGDVLTAATFVDVSSVECELPSSEQTGGVRVGVTLNGNDFSEWPYHFYYYRMLSVSPALGPLGGPTRVGAQIDVGPSLELRRAYCEMPADAVNATSTRFTGEGECLAMGGFWMQPNFLLGFAGLEQAVIGFPGALRNEVLFDVPDLGLSSAATKVLALSVGVQKATMQLFDAVSFFFYKIDILGIGPLPFTEPEASQSTLRVDLALNGTGGNRASCRVTRYDAAQEKMSEMLVLRELGSQLLVQDTDFWGPVSLRNCSSRLEVDWEFESGCHLGPQSQSWLSMQLFSRGSSHCEADAEGCEWIDDASGERWPGWWKELHRCAGAYFTAGEPDDCGLGGFCGGQSTKLDDVDIGQPECPFQAGINADAAACSNALCGPLACRTSVQPDPTCICHEGLQPALSGFATTGRYVVDNVYASENLRCPANSSSCMAWASLRIDRTEQPTDIFYMNRLSVKCLSDFKLVRAVPGMAPGEMSCMVPLEPGMSGMQVQVSLNELEWGPPTPIAFLPRTMVTNLIPRLAVESGGSVITVKGVNFVDSEHLSCYLLSSTGVGYWSMSAQYVSPTEIRCTMPDFGLRFDNNLAQDLALYVSLNGRDLGDTQVDGSSPAASLGVYRAPGIDRTAPLQAQMRFNHSITVFTSNMCVQADGDLSPCQQLELTSYYPAGCSPSTDPVCFTRTFRTGLQPVASEDVVVQVWDAEHPFFPLGVNQDDYVISFSIALEGTNDVIDLPDGNTVRLLNITLSCEEECGNMGFCTTGPPQICTCLNLNDPNTIPGVYNYEFILLPGSIPSPVTNPFYERHPVDPAYGCDQTPIISHAATVLLGPTEGGTEVRMGARFFDEEGWKKMKGYRMACEFEYEEYINGAWESTYLLTPVHVLHNDKWFPAETYDGFETNGIPTASSFNAEECGFDPITTRPTTYQCLRCLTPPSPLRPVQDPSNPPRVTIGVTISWVAQFTDEFSVREVQAEGSSIGESQPDRAGLFDGVELRFHYVDMPHIVQAEPSSVPMSTTLDIALGVSQAGDVLGNISTASLFDETAPGCRFRLCKATQCSPGQACQCEGAFEDQDCPQGPGNCVTDPSTAELVFSAEGSIVCRTSDATVQTAGVWLPSVTFNGVDWVDGELHTAISFYQFPVPLHSGVGGNKLYTFGVIPDTDSAEGEYYRLSPVAGGSTLVAYFNQRLCNATDPTDVSCQFQIQALPITLRFSPGECDPADSVGCCGAGVETELSFHTFIGINIIQMRGATPPAPLGAYHVCFSVDRNFFIPLRFNSPVNLLPADMQSLAPPSVQPIGHFRYYDLSVSGSSLEQGPNYDESEDFVYTVSLFGSGFLTAEELFGFVPKLRVDFGTRVQLQPIESMGPGSTINVVSPTELRVVVPGNQPMGRRLLQQLQELKVHVQVSLDNVVLLPPRPLNFTYFRLPNVHSWSPSYGLIEKESLLTVAGDGFIPSMIAKCRFPSSSCSAPDGTEITPCVRDAVYVSSTVFQCRAPSASGGSIDLEFSPFAPASLEAESPALFDQLFKRNPIGKFIFHRPFDTFLLDVHAAPFDDVQNRTVIVDSTGQKIIRSADGTQECMPLETIHAEGSLFLDLQNIGLSLEGASVTMPVEILQVQDTLAGCTALDGYCSSSACNPSPKQPTGLTSEGEADCCLRDDYDPVTCCPKLGTASAAAFFEAKGQCKTPNFIKYPTTTGIPASVCPTVITWEKPPVSICRGGARNNLFCCTGLGCDPGMDCPLGRCEQMPVHLKLRLATDGGQEPTGPKDSTILFFRPSNLVTGSSPDRVVKDCGESVPGARDCGWGAMEVQPASSTECGLKSFCREREEVVLDLSVDVVSGVCDNCAPISDGVATAAFSDINCRFSALFPGREPVEVIVEGTYSPGTPNAQVLCKAPVFLNPAEVKLAVALDSFRFEESPRTAVFIKRPTVQGLQPTNGIYDAETEITLHGQDFCNDTAALPCSAAPVDDDLSQQQAWCIFDFTMILPADSRWQVPRVYSPATIKSDSELTCTAPGIVPDFPVRPRARVGLILHGRFVNGELANKDDIIVSEAFFLYHARPQAVRLQPEAGPRTGGTSVTIVGNGLFSSYRGCEDPEGGAQTALQLGLRADQHCGGSEAPMLFCRFGAQSQRVPAAIDQERAASDDPNQNRFVCTSPPIADNSSNPVGVAISLNGEPAEFSNTLPFTYGEQIVTGLLPTRGSGAGGTTLLVRGQNFIDSAQLNCYFTPRVDAVVIQAGSSDRVVSQPVTTLATFISENSVTCPLPAAWEFPLACSCKCQADGVCGVTQSRRSLSSFQFNAETSTDDDLVFDPIYMSTDVTLDVADCQQRQEALSCQVRVQVGVNLQQRSTEAIPVAYEFDMRMPEVHSITPQAGPVSGDTVITITGERFPATGIGQAPPRCTFGAPPYTVYSVATRISDTKMTCTTPRACILNANGERGGVGQGGVKELGAPRSGTLCVFPFQWPPGSGQMYTECAPVQPGSTAQVEWFDGAAIPEGGDANGDGLADVYGEGFCPTTGYFAQDKQWGECTCNATDPGPVDFGVTFNLIDITVSESEFSREFAYYPDLSLTHLAPVSGPSTGGSTLSIYGSDFSEAGHMLRCLFRDEYGVNVTVVANPVSSTLLECTTPLKPDDMDARVFVSVTGNMQQFSEELQFLYYANPRIISVRTTDATDLLRTGRVDDAFDSNYKVAAGPVSGGTVVEIVGESFVEFSRCSVKQEGYIYLSASTSSTQCTSNEVCTSQNEPCTSCPKAIDCQIPFNYNGKRYFGCTSDDVTLRFPTAQPTDMWCPVNYMIPGEQDFNQDTNGDNLITRNYMMCDCTNPVYQRTTYPPCGEITFPGFDPPCPRQGELRVATVIECRFGHITVPAAVKSLVNGTNIIQCVSPPYQYGVRVPLTVTLNGADYTEMGLLNTCLEGGDGPCTYFQYLLPAPVPLSVELLPSFTQLLFRFDVVTDEAGTGGDQNCAWYFSAETMNVLGTPQPRCSWTGDKKGLVVAIQGAPTFSGTQVFEFKSDTLLLHVDNADRMLVPNSPQTSNAYDIVDVDGIIDETEAEVVGVVPDGTYDLLPNLSYPLNFTAHPSIQLMLNVSQFSRPQVTLDAAKIQDRCTENIDIDGRRSAGRFGRDFTYVEWNLVDFPSTLSPLNIQKLRSQLESFTSDSSMIANVRCTQSGTNDPVMPPCQDLLGDFNFSLTLTNWGGQSGTGFVVISRRDDVVPFASIVGELSQQVYVSDLVELQGQATASQCIVVAPGEEAPILTYQWRLTSGSHDVMERFGHDDIVKDTLDLVLLPNTIEFTPGSTYIFTLVVNQTYEGNVASASQSVEVRFMASPPVAVIAGGTRTVSQDLDLTMDGSGSYDPDLPALQKADTSGLRFCWIMAMEGDNCPLAGTIGATMDEITLTIPASKLAFGCSYHISLRVVKPDDPSFLGCDDATGHLQDLDFVMITPVEGYPPNVLLRPPAFQEKYNPRDIFGMVADVLTGHEEVTSDIEYTWEVQPLDAAGQQLLESRTRTSLEGTANGMVTLAVTQLTFEPLQVYTIYLHATQEGVTGTAQFELVVNSPPSGGTFTVSPSAGTAMKTTFTLDAPSWNDEDMPIAVSFGFVDWLNNVDVPLSAPQDIISLTAALPVGDPSQAFDLTVFCQVTDNLGAITRAECGRAGVVDCKIPVENFQGQDTTAFQSRMEELRAAGDNRRLMAYIAALSLTLEDKVQEDPTFITSVNAIKERALNIMQGQLSKGVITAAVRSQAASSVLGAIPSSGIRFAAVTQALAIIDSLLADKTATIDQRTASAISLGVSKIARGLAELRGQRRLLQATDKETQEKIVDQLRSTSIASLRPYYPGDGFVEDYGDHQITMQRIAMSDLAAAAQSVQYLQTDPQSVLNIPAGVLASVVNAIYDAQPTKTTPEAIDVFVISYTTNPLFYASDYKSYSDVLEVRIIESASTNDGTIPADIPIDSTSPLASPLQLVSRVTEAPPADEDPETGWFSVVVCAYWDTTDAWDITTVGTAAPLSDIGYITCELSHLSTFGTIITTAGCDGLVQPDPKRKNRCQVCEDVERPRTGICDWQGVACEDAQTRQSDAWTSCWVCSDNKLPYEGAVAGSSKEQHLATRERSGVCDWEGNACPAGEEVSICGLCVAVGSGFEFIEVADDGICDCNFQPNGDALKDRCGVCDGQNKSMDVCGVAAHIPADKVCHSQGEDSPHWNKACTGCDGEARPDLPWNPSPQAVNDGYGYGGLRIDRCGECGGDSSTCSGCDGLPFSPAVLDACGVCGGNNQTCTGCGSTGPRAAPVQEDAEEVCGGEHFGAPFCDDDLVADSQVCSQGCDGIPGSGQRFDQCGICSGDGSSCLGCDQQQLSQRVVDSKGRCGLQAQWVVGCDGVPNSFKVDDKCGVCNGDNECSVSVQCKDNEELDDCGVCNLVGSELKNAACAGCDGVAYSGKVFDVCGVCDGDGRSCLDSIRCSVIPCQFLASDDPMPYDQRQSFWEQCQVFDKCGICGGDGADCAKALAPSLAPDSNNIFQLVTGVLRLDALDPDTTPGWEDAFKAAMVEAGGVQPTSQDPYITSTDNVQMEKYCDSNWECVSVDQPVLWLGDIPAQIPPPGSIDVSYRVVSITPEEVRQELLSPLFVKKFKETFRMLLQRPDVNVQVELRACYDYDVCGVWCGDGRSCPSCGPCGRDSATGACILMDGCGKCGGDNTTCLGCQDPLQPQDNNERVFSGRTFDVCGVCNGNGQSCLDCAGEINGGKVLDRCMDCDGGNRQVDVCGCCAADTTLCTADPTSPFCPLRCQGESASCMGCDGIPHSGKAVDACGECGGNNLCKFEVCFDSVSESACRS